MYDSPEAILFEYQRRPRVLTRGFIAGIPWQEIPRYPLPARFFPVLTYMRNVEKLTEIYYQELNRTPTGKDPWMRRFMERWNEEEAQHGDLIDRFLHESGVRSPDNWYEQVKKEIPRRYTVENYLYGKITRVFGKNFSGVHMVWGAINELSTLQGYRRLIELTGHPVLTQLLRGIMQEESTHIFFYFNIARLKLEASGFSRVLARKVIEKFWGPVGQGIRPHSETDFVIGSLFQGTAGLQAMERQVNAKIAQLPGFTGFTGVIKKIAERVSKVTATSPPGNCIQGLNPMVLEKRHAP